MMQSPGADGIAAAPAPFWQSLESHAGAVALDDGQQTLTYAALALAADAACDALRAQLAADLIRPLVLLEMDNSIAAVVQYIGLLRAGWPTIIAAPHATPQDSAIARQYTPNLIMTAAHGTVTAQVMHTRQIVMDDALSIMLSTSGSTGAPKLVRLSRANITHNAAAIIDYLGITPQDRAATVLPLHYSYGLSVLHSHLGAGAALFVTAASLIDAQLWPQLRAAHITSLALVPTQFRLLEQAGFTRAMLPDLRMITQAGGRLAPAAVQRWAAEGARDGWQLVIMYGQTEAAPRMAYLPPADALTAADCIGRAIPGGALHLIDDAGSTIAGNGVAGELVYRGPNVMMGYANDAADLALGAGPAELRTGDIAERTLAGHFRITGRASRFIKLHGLRIGLDAVESALSTPAQTVVASGTDDALVLFIETGAGHIIDAPAMQDAVAQRWGLPATAVIVEPLEALPLMPSGKPDHALLRQQAQAAISSMQQAAHAPTALHAMLCRALRQSAPDLDQSFLAAGGDSLAAVDMHLTLSQHMAQVPDNWAEWPLRDLLAAAQGAPPPARGHGVAGAGAWAFPMRVPTDAALRAIAMLAVIALHATRWPAGGGAYLLMLLGGFSLARFQRPRLERGDVGASLRTMLLPLIMLYVAMLALMMLAGREVGWPWLVLAGNFVAPPIRPPGLEPYWFISAYAQAVMLLTAPFLFPPLRRRIAAAPFASAIAALSVACLAMWVLGLAETSPGLRLRHPAAAAQLMLTGWVMALAADRAAKLVASALALAVWALFWRDVGGGVMLAMLAAPLLIVWLPRIALPRLIAQPLLRFAMLGMFVYVLHVPVISIVTRLLPSVDTVQFAATVTLTSALAFVGHRAFAWRWARGTSPAADGASAPPSY